MAAITATKALSTEFSGEMKTKLFTSTLESASDDLDLSTFFDTIYGAFAVLEAGQDAALLGGLVTSFSGTTVTVVSQEQDGTASTNWTGATIRLYVYGSDVAL